MAIYQEIITLSPKSKGFHLITQEIENALDSKTFVKSGLLHLFIQHTSASLSINENADPTVREDMENFFTELADDKPYYIHTYEGVDDMPAHIKASMLGNSLTIPITNGKMNLGTWQGIYLYEHRSHPHHRQVLRRYAGTNEAELFAVAVEVFFERPKRLKADDPELYELLAERVANRDLYSLRYRVRQPLQKRLMSNVDSLLEKADAARWRRKFESRLPR